MLMDRLPGARQENQKEVNQGHQVSDMRWSTSCMWGVFPKLCQNAWKVLVKNTAGFNGYITGAIRRKFSKVRVEADLLPWRNSRKVPRKREIQLWSIIHQCAAAFKFASCIRYPGASTVNRVIRNLHPFENIFRFSFPLNLWLNRGSDILKQTMWQKTNN